MGVTLVTEDATLDDLGAEDYRDIYDELRQRNPETGEYGVGLDRFVTMVTSSFSKATWWKYHQGELGINRQMRNELRQAVGLPALPLTVADAVAVGTSPDAAVWRVGEGVAEHVILVGAEPVTLHVNGAVQVEDFSPVTEVTPVRVRPRLVRPVATADQDARRAAAAATWRDVIDAGLAVVEAAALCRDDDGPQRDR